MALRLRRGTDAQRLLITPAEGELIYTTDTKSLYVGDGTTVGGLIVTAGENINLGELNDVDLITNPPSTNQVLKWDGVNWVPADDIGEDLVDYIIQDGHDFRINIVALDSTRMVDIAENKFTGDLFGDVYDPTTDFKVVENVARWSKLDIRADDDTVILQHNTGNLFDASGTLLVDGGLRVFYGDVDGGIRGDVVGPDLNVIINHITGEITGDLRGSVFGDDSSILVDGLSGKIVGTIDTDSPANFGKTRSGTGRVFTVYSNTHLAFSSPVASIINTGDTAVVNELNLLKTRGTADVPTSVQAGDSLGSLSYSAHDGTSAQVAASIRADVGNVSTGNIDADLCFYTRNGAIGTYTKKAELGANGTFSVDQLSPLNDEAITLESILRLLPASAAPTTPEAGMIAVDDGSNWSGVATNGTDETLVTYLNGAWTKVI